MGANQGDPAGQMSLATMTLLGCGVAQDHQEARRLMQLSADQGKEKAQLSVAEYYRLGVGGEQNFVEAARYCRLAMDQGNKEAHYLYAVITLNDGDDVAGDTPADEEQKNRLLIRGAECGHPKVQLIVAKMLCNGDGVAVDKEEAARFCRLAIAQGDASAMTFLAQMLVSGENADRDKAEAVELLKRAWKEDAEAAVALGTMYYCGDGVDKNDTNACVMFVQAVENGLKSEVDAALRSAGYQGSFNDFKAKNLPVMPGVAWSK
jgi:TPR repeat protein